jgi:DNA-binding response OmpR family regulator
MAGKTVIIVDDDRSFVDAVALLFEEFNYRALKAYGGREGLETVRRDRVDVAIIDVNMPDMDGVELASRIAGLPKPVPTILISSDDSGENADRCRALGTGIFLAKPLDPEVLLETVSRILATRT